ncbi:hypothetical protein LTR08_005453 [Meristemomyces frigidus]|nr:hypothetical protein LTR08_005453 [Meristemomyces frigidus]
MRSTLTIGLALAFLSSLASALDQDRTVDVFTWPLSASSSKTIAQITYNSTFATINSYNAPSFSASDDIVRVGFYHSSGAWSGIATSALNFAPGKDKKLVLHVNGGGELYHIGFRASEGLGTSSATSNTKDGMSVEVVKVKSGPTPHLNRPVVLSPDGSAPEKEPEKSFFQKYWWAIAGVLLLQVVMSMGKGE